MFKVSYLWYDHAQIYANTASCFAFNLFQRDLCLQLNIKIRYRRNSPNTLSVEFAAKSFFPISPEIKNTDSQGRMYFGDPRQRGLPNVRFDGAAVESTAVKQTLTETKRLDTRPKIFVFFLSFSTPLFLFFPLSFTYHSLHCPPVSFFLFFSR